MGDYFEGFIDEEARALSLTREAIRAWAPPAGRARGRGRSRRDRLGDRGRGERSRSTSDEG